MAAAAAAEQAVEPAVPAEPAVRVVPVVLVDGTNGKYGPLAIMLIPDTPEARVCQVIGASQGPAEQAVLQEIPAQTVSMGALGVPEEPAVPVVPVEIGIITAATVMRAMAGPLIIVEETATAVIMHSQPVMATEETPGRPELTDSQD